MCKDLYEAASLKLVLEMQAGKDFPQASKELIEDKNGFFYYKVDDLNNTSHNLMLEDSTTKVSIIGKPLPKQSILIPKRGEAINTNKVVICNTECFFDSNIMGLETSNKYNTKFFAYFLLARTLRDLVDKTTIPQINNKHIKPLHFPIPSLVEEQTQIANVLDEETSKIDSLIRNTQFQIEKLQEYRKTIIAFVITGKIDVREAIA